MKPVLHPLALLLIGSVLLGLSGCALLEPPPVDFAPLAFALEFVGVCSVACSLIWGWSLVSAAKLHQQTKKNAHPDSSDPRRGGGVLPRGGDRLPLAGDAPGQRDHP